MKRALAALLVLGLLGWSLLKRPQPQIVGLWVVGAPRQLADDLRFYYFHEGDKGLYRYGQVGLNQTHSFDWHVSGDTLTLTFRKTGETVRTRFAIEERDGRRTLVLAHDPRNDGTTRYVQRKAELDLDTLGGPLEVSQHGEASTQGALAGRMWMSTQRFATGGMRFRMYQLSSHALDGGRSLGWFHTGDFDDWTTETLAYKEAPLVLELAFPLRREQAAVPMTLEPGRQRRVLTLARDPRDFGAKARFEDAGASF